MKSRLEKPTSITSRSISDVQKCHPAGLPLDRLRAECDVRFSRKSGPGGQHRNKVETAVTLTHQPTGTVGQATERRSQAQNLRMALRRLRSRLALAERRPWQRPSELWQSRCRHKRLAVSHNHEDFPALVAEALDALAAAAWSVVEAAELLGCSTSQLIRLLRHEPEALGQLNQHRIEQGVRPLK